MNGKLLVLLGALAAVVVAVGAVGSGAWFTDQERVDTDISLSTLNVSVDVRDPGPGGPCSVDAGTADAGVAVGWDLTGLAPGEERTRCLTVRNAGGLPAKYRIRADELAGHPNLSQLPVAVERGQCQESAVDSPEPVIDGTLADLDGDDVDGPGAYVAEDGSWGGTLAAGATRCYLVRTEIQFWLPNELQGAQGSFALVVDATQQANPGWVQMPTTTSSTTQLPGE